MTTVHDVASYIIEWRGMTAMKLQKLVYYSQAWHLAEHGQPLFAEPIEAWANGPVVRDLYDHHRGRFSISSWPQGDKDNLSGAQRETVDRVIRTYGHKDAQWLSDESHQERPWREARAGIPEGSPSSTEIQVAGMRAYYEARLREGLDPENAALRA